MALIPAYAPQLATQLHLSSTQVNLVGLAGNAGMYTMGPLSADQIAIAVSE